MPFVWFSVAIGVYGGQCFAAIPRFCKLNHITLWASGLRIVCEYASFCSLLTVFVLVDRALARFEVSLARIRVPLARYGVPFARWLWNERLAPVICRLRKRGFPRLRIARGRGLPAWCAQAVM